MTRIVVFIAAACVLAACETVEGFGQDVETAGEGIQNTSNEVQN